jgi:Origin recognition complex subunit 6 (ORC6)
LKIKLDLPDFQVRPPCSRKIYEKLFTYFQSVLGINGGVSRPGSAAQTPSKRKRVDEAITGTGTPGSERRKMMAVREKQAGSIPTTPSKHSRRVETPLVLNGADTPSKRWASIQARADGSRSPTKSRKRDALDQVVPGQVYGKDWEIQDQLDEESEVPVILSRQRTRPRAAEEEFRFRGGEMLNYATDYLTEDRRREYKAWKTEIMRLITEKSNE